jgi:hypothetical protein
LPIYLERLGNYSDRFRNDRKFKIEYFYIAGSCFRTWLCNTDKLKECIKYKPDYLVIALGGNSIVESVRDIELQEYCYQFYEVLKEKLPNCVLIGVQMERRLPVLPNKFGKPEFRVFSQRRLKFNKFLKKLKIKTFKLTYKVVED